MEKLKVEGYEFRVQTAERVAEQVEEIGQRAELFQTDVSREKEVLAMFAHGG